MCIGLLRLKTCYTHQKQFCQERQKRFWRGWTCWWAVGFLLMVGLLLIWAIDWDYWWLAKSLGLFLVKQALLHLGFLVEQGTWSHCLLAQAEMIRPSSNNESINIYHNYFKNMYTITRNLIKLIWKHLSAMQNTKSFPKENHFSNICNDNAFTKSWQLSRKPLKFTKQKWIESGQNVVRSHENNQK